MNKTNVDIIVITVSMCKRYDFETIYTSNDVMNIHYAVGKIFGSRERSYSMGVYSYFGPRTTHTLHTKHTYRPGK